MSQDDSVTGPDGIISALIGHKKPGPKSNFAARMDIGRRREVKKRALIFAGLFLMVFLVLVALFEQGLDPGIATQNLLGKFRSTDSSIGWRQVPALFLLGLGAGLLGGMLGLGGGVVKIAGMLLLFNLDIFFARAVSMTTMFFTAASAAYPYAKKGFPDWKTIGLMLPMALVGVLGGLLLGNQLRGSTLTHIFGFFMLFLGLYTLAMVFDDPKEHIHRKDHSGEMPHKHHQRMAASISALHGFICGVLGISGGVISVPMQQLLLNTPVRNSIANTLVISAVCSGLGSITVITIGVGRGVFSLEHILFTVMCIGVGAVIGGQIGARVGVKSNAGVLRFLFVLISFGAGLSLLI